MTKARELAKLGEVMTNSQIGGRRNLIINGAMQVAQRGTTGTLNNGASNFHSADRFYSSEEGDFTGAFTVSNDTDAPVGFSNSTKWDCTTADTTLGASDSFFVDHKIEAQNLQHLKYGTSEALQITLSFFIKSNKTGTYVVWLYNYDANRQVSVSYTINVANTWEYKTLTFPSDTTGSFNNDTGAGMVVRFIMGSGTTYTSGTAPSTWESLVDANRYVGQTVNLADSTDNFMNITGIQLEVGSQATPFEHRSFGEELALCQRYYQRRTATNTRGSLLYGNGANSTTVIAWADLLVPLRTSPTLTTSGLARDDSNGPVSVSATSINTTYSSLVRPCVSCETTSVTQYRPYSIGGNNNSSAYVGLDSEL